ncbi:uncharacterized protein AtWU_01339 [Aspergillus tubingensis]|uniref:uncharacterized protein n=1 Tax=Aspergillus tubingensis TaxID=5068 RepID=UPI001577B67C|nr:uncharacterized protein AtWU_01339 [Aspergillus tubingensis]GFN11542.1 hypothetical protein AtWU_01339 [Aspergillus tubingensis]
MFYEHIVYLNSHSDCRVRLRTHKTATYTLTHVISAAKRRRIDYLYLVLGGCNDIPSVEPKMTYRRRRSARRIN